MNYDGQLTIYEALSSSFSRKSTSSSKVHNCFATLDNVGQDFLLIPFPTERVFFFFGVANELISITIPSFVVVVALISADNYTNMGFTLMTDDALSRSKNSKPRCLLFDSIHRGARYLLMNTIGNESPVSPRRRRSKTKRDGLRKG